MMKKTNVRLRPKAAQDLTRIYEYSYQEFGSIRAEQYIKDLDSAFHKLAEEPSLGRDYGHIRRGLFAYKIVSHIIFFKLAVNEILIIRVLHGSMDHGRHF